MRNKAIDWKKVKHLANIETTPEKQIKEVYDSQDLPCKAFINEWIDEPTDDEDILFLKNIITLALYSKQINHAIKMIGISRASFWKYHKIAKQKLYDDYHATNTHNLY